MVYIRQSCIKFSRIVEKKIYLGRRQRDHPITIIIIVDLILCGNNGYRMTPLS